MAEEFSFKHGDKVKITVSGETGTVIGRADYLDDGRKYYVRYVTTQGRATEEWWAEGALEAA